MPPRHVYSAVVRNTSTTPHQLTVTATYQVPPTGTSESLPATSLSPGASFTVPQKLVTIGSMVATGHILKLDITAQDVGTSSATGQDVATAVVHAPFAVWSPVKDYPLDIAYNAATKTIDVTQPSRHPNA